MRSLELADFHYDLPRELIAQTPAPERSGSRLLLLPAEGPVHHVRFPDLVDRLRPGDLLVVNDTRVVPARLFARKDSGGRAEVFLERILATDECLCQVRVSKALRRDGRLFVLEDRDGESLGDAPALAVGRREGPFYVLRRTDGGAVLELFERFGHTPLPPYIERPAEHVDAERYQTVFAEAPGSVAAPTAALHFDPVVLDRIAEKGVRRARVTLHVGAGTFTPVRDGDLSGHVMHSEWLRVPPETADAVRATRAAGGRVVAVGTTVVRSLETAALAGAGTVSPYEGETDLFIRPGHRFAAIDALLTNFHLPESTLLMLVCAFGGHERVMAAYREAVAQRYRFFSYGDAMFLEHAPGPDADAGP